MKRITSFKEAREELARIKKSIDGFLPNVEALYEFIGRAENTINAVNELRGEEAKEVKDVKPINGDVPEGWNQRVLYILNRSEGPMMQKDVVDRYEALGWPKPKSGDLYSSVSGAMNYLLRRTGQIERTNNGYIVKK